MNSIFATPPVPAMKIEAVPPIANDSAPEPIESNGLIQKLRSRFSSSAIELERKRAETEQNGRDMHKAEQELGRLTVILENETAALKHADTVIAGRKAEILQIEEKLLDLWGNSALRDGPNYGPLVALRATVEDFPRCRKHLVAKVEAAKRALREFEKNSS